MNWAIEKIINVAKELKTQGYTGASTSEQIAAAFVLNTWHIYPMDTKTSLTPGNASMTGSTMSNASSAITST